MSGRFAIPALPAIPRRDIRILNAVTSDSQSRTPSSGSNLHLTSGKMDITTFAQDHISQLTVTVGVMSYALLRNKLTPGGILAGLLIAFIHMLHPWPAFFWLLIVFFLLGTFVTKVCFPPGPIPSSSA